MAMEPEEAAESRQLAEVHAMMESPGWGHCLKMLGLLRERMIRDFAQAPLSGPEMRHGPEYYQGALAGFERAVQVFDRLETRFKELVEAGKESKNGE